MSSDRREEITLALYENAGNFSLGQRITTLGTELLGADHCSLVLSMGYDITTITGGTSLTSVIDERQMVLGDGPTVSAVRDSTPMILADTNGFIERERWPLFCDEAVALGVRGVLSFPIFTAAIRLGALTAYWTTPHSPTPSEYADGSLLADVALEAILNDLAGISLDSALSELDQDVQHHMLVQQAVGMVSEQLSIPVLEAMVRIRSAAYSSHRRLIEVATAIISRQERLEK
jgi:hypothetical protein